jgi:hypothetical protein
MNRWSRITLVLDACFLLFMGLSATASALMSSANGSGVMGSLFLGQPFVLGFVEATLLVAVIGAGLLLAAFREPRPVTWHVFAIIAHVALACVDIGYADSIATLGMGGTGYTLPVLHALFVVAHLVGIRLVRSAPAPAPASIG